MQKQRSGIVIGVILLGLGALLLMAQIFQINLAAFLWPFFIIVPGLTFFVGMALGGKKTGPLAIPGSVVTMTGLLLLYANTFNHWESWAYSWTMIGVAVGIGLAINGAWSDIDKLIDRGLRVAGVGMAAFLVLGMFFEIVLNISNNPVANVIWPLMLIGFGLYLLSRSSDESDQQDGPPSEGKAPVRQQEFEPIDMTRTDR